MLLIAKGLFSLSTCENIWMCRLALRLDFKLVFPFQTTSSQKISFLPWLFNVWIFICNSNLMLYPRQHLICGWVGDNMILFICKMEASICYNNLFEANDTTRHGLARQLKAMLEKFGFTFKILCYIKDEGTNLGNMTSTLKFVISCEALNLHVLFNGSCFRHAMSKATQYATNDDKISKDLSLINVKFAQTSL